jgi:hypothetical protein
VERKFKNNEKLLLILDIDEILIHATKKGALTIFANLSNGGLPH